MNGFKYPCPNCGHSIHVEETRCVACGIDAPGPPGENAAPDTDQNELPGTKGWFPTGLILALAVWFGLGYAVLEWDKRTSPEYEAAAHAAAAEELLAPDDGATTTPENLAKAAEGFLLASTLLKTEVPFWPRLDRIQKVAHERHLTLPAETQRRIDFLAAGRANRLKAESTSMLVSTPQDRWDIEGLLALRSKGANLLKVGSIFIIAIYAWWWIQRRRTATAKIKYANRGPRGGR